MNIDYFMKEAIKQAKYAFDNNEVPVGGILVDKNTNEILWSIIELKSDMVGERVLEHELGHAIGWMHTRAIGHIMNESLARGGWDSTGLENRSSVIKNDGGFNYGYR